MKSSLEKDSTQLEILNRIRKNINEVNITLNKLNKSVNYYADTINFKTTNMFSKMSDPYVYENSEYSMKGNYDVYPNSTYLDKCIEHFSDPRLFLVDLSSNIASIHINDIAYGDGIYMACGHYMYYVDESGMAATSGRIRIVPRIWTSNDGENWCMRNDFDLGDTLFDENNKPNIDGYGDYMGMNEIYKIVFSNGYFIMCDCMRLCVSDGEKIFTNYAWDYRVGSNTLPGYDIKTLNTDVSNNHLALVGFTLNSITEGTITTNILGYIAYNIPVNEILNKLTKGHYLNMYDYICTLEKEPKNAQFMSVVIGSEGYVAIGNEGCEGESQYSTKPFCTGIYYSKDGHHWFDTDIKDRYISMGNVIYNDGTYIAIGYFHDSTGKTQNYSYVYVSYDVEHWTKTKVVDETDADIAISFNCIRYHGGKYFVFKSNTNHIYCSDDLQHFSKYNISESINDFGICENIIFGNATDNSTLYISKSTPIITRDITNDEILKSKYPPGSIILSRSPYNTPRDYLGFGTWQMCERCNGICEYIRIY